MVRRRDGRITLDRMVPTMRLIDRRWAQNFLFFSTSNDDPFALLCSSLY